MVRRGYPRGAAGLAAHARAAPRIGRFANTPCHRRATLPFVANLEKRGSYTPRRVRERRAYQLVVTGGAAGAVFVVSLVLSIVGVIGATLPVISLIVAVICAVLFRSLVRPR
jgi:hypothetical protein